MLTKKKKLSRKEIKEDRLVSFYYKTQDFIEEHKSKIAIYGLVLVIAVIAVFLYLNNKSKSNEEAALHLSRAMNLYEAGAYLEAIEGRQGTDLIGLKKTVEEYGNTENGETAKIYLANSYLFLDKPEEAYKYYEDYDGDINILKAASLAGQAAYFVSKKEYNKAAELYQEASRISEENLNNSDYLLDAGINFMKAGETESAKEIFERIKKDYPNTTASRSVDRFLAELK